MEVARLDKVSRVFAIRSFQFSGLTVSEARLVPKDGHSFVLDFGQIAIAVEGHFRDVDSPADPPYELGDVAIRTEGRLRAMVSDRRQTRAIIVEFDPSRGEQLRSLFSGTRTFRLHAEVFPRLIGSLLRDWAGDDFASRLAVSSIVLSLAATAARIARRDPQDLLLSEWLRRAIRVIEGPLRRTPALSALALSVGVPETRLADEFFRLRGCSIREWVRRERMDDSIRELVWSSDAVDRVAVRAGYHDAPHFIREFKRATGSTPGSFRKSCREAMLS